MMDVRRLQILRAVVHSGSVTAAARALDYTPSAVSQQIAALEKETGTALLERVGRGVRPTAAGVLLSEHAELVARQLDLAQAALADLLAGRTGRLAVRYFATAGAHLVAPAVAEVRREHPGVRVELRLTDAAHPLAAVRDGHADAVLVVGEERCEGVRVTPLLDDPYVVVLPAGHPAAGPDTVDLASLAGEPWVGSEWPGPCLDAQLTAFADAGFRPEFVVDSEDYITAQGFVAAGLGIALIPRLGLGGARPDLAVRPLAGRPAGRRIYVGVREGAETTPALRTFVQALRRAAEPRREREPHAR
ncbi:LysR family transcriptional regulator [Streptomyces sp. ST1015]|uniref:LysR family transcriptional regulator n=1 Tax=unclassified Streptomyces TaxID=2593676 RepID=UPI001CA728CB|nr:LysR family transcriptional regulator [Streptomyces sp. ST1015]QZZ27445.1 LysR family transcriptional regulator [Streptomyces sp. ST1015]